MDIAQTNPAPYSTLHRSQAVELYFFKRLDLTTVNVNEFQVHDDTLDVDLGVAGRVSVDGVNSDIGTDKGVIRVYPLSPGWPQGHQIQLVLTDGLKYHDSSQVTLANYTYQVESSPNHLLMAPGIVSRVSSKAWWETLPGGLLPRLRSSLIAAKATSPQSWVGPAVTPKELRASSALAVPEAQRALSLAIGGTVTGDTAAVAQAAEIVNLWALGFDPEVLTPPLPGLFTSGYGNHYARMLIQWFLVYPWLNSGAVDTSAFKAFVEGHVDTFIDAHTNPPPAGPGVAHVEPSSAHSWVNAAALLASHFLQDYRLESWALTGTEYQGSENNCPHAALQTSSVRSGDVSRGEATPNADLRREREISKLYSWSVIAHALWVNAVDRSEWEVQFDEDTPLYRLFKRYEGYAARPQQLWQLRLFARYGYPNLLANGPVGSPDGFLSGDLPGDVLGPYPRVEPGQSAPILPEDPGDDWETAQTWITATWRGFPASLQAWVIELDGTEVGVSTQEKFTLSALTPATSYSVRIGAKSEAINSVTVWSRPVEVRTLEF